MPTIDDDSPQRTFRPLAADETFEAPANDQARTAIREAAEMLPEAYTPVMIAEEVAGGWGIEVTEAAVRGVLVHNL